MSGYVCKVGGCILPVGHPLPHLDPPASDRPTSGAPEFCPACRHLEASHGTKRKMCLACERPLNGPPGEPCPLTINGAIRFDCAGCDAVAHDLGGDETLGWVWDADGVEVFCPACVAAPVVSSEGEADEEYEGCDCTELCSMGPTCPGGGLAGLPGSGCWRTGADDTEIAKPHGAREILIDRYMESVRDELIAAGWVSPADLAAALATARAEGRADGLREGADELWRVFLRLPHTPSPVSDFVQRRVLHLRELAAAALSEEPT